MTLNPQQSFTDLGYCAAIRPTAPRGTLAPYCVRAKDHQEPSHRDPYGEEWTDAPAASEVSR